MARPIWSGALTFGIVNIAVRMFPAIRDHDIHFHQISSKDRRRIRYLKVAEGGSEPVPAEDIVKGYEVGDGRYVTFADEELRQLAAKRSKVIEITAFVQLSEIDPRFFDRPNYLLPEEGAEKAYRLLVEALAASGRVGIARVVIHSRESLVAIRSLDGVLMLQNLRFADEVVPAASLDGKPPAAKVNPKELGLAQQLVESMSTAFDPGDYHDEYRERVQAAIDRKAHGKTLALVEEEAPAEDGKVIDLMDALQRSLAKRSGKAPAPAAASAPAPARHRPRRQRAG